MSKITKKFNSEFAKNVLTLLTGSSIAQLVPIAIAPVLSRIYSPDNFGQLGVFMAIISVFAVLATLQYESAIMLPKEDKDSFSLLVLSVLISILISLISFLLLFFLNARIAELINIKFDKEWIYIIPLFILITGLFNSLNIWSSRKKQFKRLAIRQITQTTVNACTKLSLGWLNYLNTGLIFGSIFGRITSTSILLFLTINDSKYLFKEISISRIFRNAKKYKDFPKYTLWQGFFDIVNASSIIFILNYYYGAVVVGFFVFTRSLIKKPTDLIGKSVSQVFFQKASYLESNNQSIYSDSISLLKNLGILGAIMFIPIFVFGPYLFSLIFGDKWREAGIIAQIISPWYYFRFIASPLGRIAQIKKQQKQFLFISTGMNMLLPLLLFISGYSSMEYKYTFMVISTLMVVYLSITLKLIINYTK